MSGMELSELYLYDANVRFLSRLIDRNFGDSLYPVLDSGRNMRNNLQQLSISYRLAPCSTHLNSLSKIISSTLGGNIRFIEGHVMLDERTSFSMTSR